MQETPFSDSALDELILIMQMSLYDADVAINQSHDVEEVQALREHKKAVQKWIKHFQQLKAKQHKQGG